MENKTLNTSKIFWWLFALTTLFLAVSPLNNNGLNYLFRIPSLLLIVYMIVGLYGRIKNNCFWAVLTLSLIIIFHFIIDTDINFDIFLACFSVIAFLLLVIISGGINVDDSLQKFVNKCSIISAFVLIGYALSPMSHLADYGGYIMQCPYLTYGFNNSNYAGIITFLVNSMIFITMESAGKKTKRLCYVLAIILIYLTYLTNTRSALVASLLIPISGFVFSRFKFSNRLLFLLCLVPFLFVPFYIKLGLSGNADGAQIMGKSIMSGRQEVYMEFIETLRSDWYWLFGNLSENKFMNAHNGPLAIFVSVGVIGGLAFFFVVISKLLYANRTAVTLQNKVAVFVILASLINTCGEAALLLGGFPGVTYLFAFFVFATSHRTESYGK